MTATQKGKKNGEKAAEPAAAPEDKFDKEVEKTAETLLKACSKVRVRRSWFSTSAKIDDATMGEMMGEKVSKTIKDAISASKRLLKSKHKALVGATQAYAAISAYVDSMTIPLIALKVAGDDDSVRKDGGVRLIQKKDMVEFDGRMQYLIGVLNTAVQKLQEAMPEIMEEDRVRLNKLNSNLFKASDYPEDVTKLIGVVYSFEPIGVDADWQKLCPEIYARESIAARQKYEAVVESAAIGYASKLVNYVEQVVRQLGNRTRLDPKKEFKGQLVKYDDDKTGTVDVSEAEVLRKLDHSDDPDIPENYVRVRLRLAKKDGAKGSSTEVWLNAMKSADYYTLMQPYTTDEKNKLYDSTVDNLKAELQAFANIGEMFGPYKDVAVDGVEKITAMLKKASSSMNTSAITQQLRDAEFFRNEMKGALEEVAKKVEGQITSVKARRRTIKTSLLKEDVEE